VPLNAKGRCQAAEAGRRLAALHPEPGRLPYVASPLGRTRDTMSILRGAIGLPPDGYEQDSRLIELTFGEWEGLTWREVKRRDPGGAAGRERGKWAFTPPGGESYAALRDRVAPAVASLTGPTVLVSHGGVARALLNLLAGVPEALAPSVDIWQGRVLVIADGAHRWA
jgi:probable phosphoglycerate mutase